jgi:HK97 family phage major capsid protein
MKTLQEQRAQLASNMVALNDKAKTEDRGLSNEERTQWDAMVVDVDAMDLRISDEKKADEQRGFLKTPVNAIDMGSPSEPKQEERGYDSIFSDSYLKSIDGPSMEERSILRKGFTDEHRALGAATDSAGGYTVPEGFGGSIISTMKQYGGVMNIANIMTTASGNPIPFPTNNDTGNTGGLLTENSTDSEQDTVFGQVNLDAHFNNLITPNKQ